MSKSKPGENWDRLKNLDHGELNEVNSDVFEPRYDHGQSITTTLSEIIAKHYSYDDLEGKKTFVGYVLEVLSGPQVKNEATTGGRANTTSVNIDEYPFPFFKDRKDANKAMPVIVKVRVPEVDKEIAEPKDFSDKVRIDLHGEFYQAKDDPELSKIDIGSMIRVEYSNNKTFKSINGRPEGIIDSVISPGQVPKDTKKTSPQDAMNPDCQAAINRSGPAGGFYVGHTDSDPSPNIGPPIRKIKGHIKTGIYGNGAPNTKAHFEQALEEAPNSVKHSIPGPAPGPDNAFIWIGNLKNNGYLDLLDRPLTAGRETIIYAPMTLDLSAPIEIKYYFHDKAGFGHAHVNGPETTIVQAMNNATLAGNDFREKIAPAIKDLNKEGRNYILVIPEMAYSRGYGTSNGDLDRISNISSGVGVSMGEIKEETIRTKVDAATRGAVKSYLDSLPIETFKNLLHVTPLRERELSTFDGSFTGGKFGDFHTEVLDVLDEHLGTIYDKVEFVSFLADGQGGIALASIVNDVKFSSVHNSARVSFKNALVGKNIRIDFITDDNMDSNGYYDYYFGSLSPSTAIWQHFLLDRSETGQGYTEFNYITTPSTKQQSPFFVSVDKNEEYEKNSKSASGIGQRKFSFFTTDVAVESFISFHVSPKDSNNKKNRVGYAFSLINDFLESFQGPPQKPDANTSLKPGFSEVPDHAYALSTKPSVGDLEKILNRQGDLSNSISSFESIIIKFLQDSEQICFDFPRYCQDGSLDTRQESSFFKEYLRYLDNKKEYEENFILAENEQELQKIINDKKALSEKEEEITNFLISSREEAEKIYANGSSWFDTWIGLINEFKESTFSGLDPFGLVTSTAFYISREHAYEKILNKVKSAAKKANPEKLNRPKDCAPQPKKVRIATAPPGTVPQPGKSNEPGNNCSDINIITPSTYEELVKMIPYKPVKQDFSYNNRSSKTKTQIHLVDGYKTSKFKYPARASEGQITHKTSPPMWACITENIEKAWKEASEETKYYPFEITTGIRGSVDPKTSGTTAYVAGMSLHSFGLAFDLDPFIAGYSRRNTPVYSVYTGAWTAGFVEKHAKTLYHLGVYKYVPSIMKKNAFEEDNRPRLAENWKGAPAHYKGSGESGTGKSKYVKIMNAAKGAPIVPLGANPPLWILLFCEKSGMNWGNGKFLKKRWRGGKTWNKKEKDLISSIYGIPNFVDRIQAISWNSRIEDHMHIHFWKNKSLIFWNEIHKISKK